MVYNPDGTRIMFFLRANTPAGFQSSLWTVDPTGHDLVSLIPWGHGISHFTWLDCERLLISTDLQGAMQFMVIEDHSGRVEPFGAAGLPDDGHPELCKNSCSPRSDVIPSCSEFHGTMGLGRLSE